MGEGGRGWNGRTSRNPARFIIIRIVGFPEPEGGGEGGRGGEAVADFGNRAKSGEGILPMI